MEIVHEHIKHIKCKITIFFSLRNKFGITLCGELLFDNLSQVEFIRVKLKAGDLNRYVIKMNKFAGKR